MLAEATEQFSLNRVERIRPLQAHDLAETFARRLVVVSRPECHLADDPLFVVVIDLINFPRLLADTSLDFVVVAAA